MSLVTDYIKTNRPTCIGLWDFGAGSGNPMNVAEILHGISNQTFVGTTGAWTTGQIGSGFAGQNGFATIASAGNPQALISTSAGADPFAFNLAAPFTYEIMFQLANLSGTYDLIGPDGNTNGGMALRYNTASGKWENVKNYISVPVTGVATPTTAWTILAGTIDSGNLWRLYVNGVQDGSTSGVVTPTSPTGTAALDMANCNHANNTPPSSYGYIAIYNSALSAAELLANYQFALNGQGPGTVDPTLGAIHPIVHGLVG